MAWAGDLEMVEHPASKLETVENPAVTAGTSPGQPVQNLRLAGRSPAPQSNCK